jgi:hypothetical protein
VKRYTTKILTTEADFERVRSRWEELRQKALRPSLEQHPDWLALEVASKPGARAVAIALYDGSDLVGLAPFLLRPWEWQCRVAYTRVASFPVRLLDLCGQGFVGVESVEAAEALLLALARSDLPFDLLYLEDLPTGSPLAHVLRDSTNDGLWRYAPGGPRAHWLIKLAPTFEQYLTKFSGRRRSTLRNANRRIDKHAKEATWIERITEPAQVPAFLAHVKRVSSVSWQGTRLQQVVEDDERERKKLAQQAERGWLRCYLLRSGENAVAFAIAEQVDGVFTYERIGYDPAWSNFRPGGVLLYRILEDLHAHDRPIWFDFGTGDAAYKQFWGTETYNAVDMYVLRPTPYMGLVRTVKWSLGTAENVARQSIDRLGLRARVSRYLKRGSTVSAETEDDSEVG